jgi:hypothetical protein
MATSVIVRTATVSVQLTQRQAVTRYQYTHRSTLRRERHLRNTKQAVRKQQLLVLPGQAYAITMTYRSTSGPGYDTWIEIG